MKINIIEGVFKVCLGDIGGGNPPPNVRFGQSCPPAPPGEPSAQGPRQMQISLWSVVD